MSSNTTKKSQVDIWTDTYKLSPQSKKAWSRILIVFGIIPSLVLFFYWVERNCKYSPFLTETTPISIKHLVDLEVIKQCLWNARYFVIFCFVHSLAARTPVKILLEGFIPPQTTRATYVIQTGILLFLTTMYWHHTGIYVWSWNTAHPFLTNLISMLVFWTLHIYVFTKISRWSFPEMLGFTQLNMQVKDLERYDSRPPNFETEGIFSWVRHPAYTLIIAMMLVTPILSLDRLWLAVMTSVYCIVAIPFQERALVQHFGIDYIKYQASTPALIPHLPKVVTEVRSSMTYKKIHKH